MLPSLLSLSLFAVSASALAYNGPRATPVFKATGDLLNHPPGPTKAPYFDHELLFRRQNVQTDLLAPDNTCGYISGKPDAGYFCYATTDTCAFFPTTAGFGFVGCCNTLNCGARLTCVDSSQFYSQTFCDNACQKGTFTLKCTASTAPYCNGIRFLDAGVQDYFCDAVTVSTWQTANSTYLGQKGRTFSPVTVTLTTTDLTAPPVISSNTNTLPGSSTSTSGSSTSTGPSTTTSPPAPPTTSAAAGKSTPVGAIAGGTVGGVAVLAGAIFGIWFFLRRKNKKPTDAHNSAPPPSYVPQNGDTAYGAAAAGKPTPTAQEQQFAGQYAPQGQQGYAPVPQNFQQQPYGQQPMQQPMQQIQNQHYAPPIAEAPGSTSYGSPSTGAATLAAGAAAYDPHHSTGPQTPYSQHSQPLTPNSAVPQPHSPNSTAHLSAAYPERGDATSPISQHRLSAADGGAGAQNTQYQAYTPYVPPTGQGGSQPVEMMSSGAGPWPTNLHDGTYEAPGADHRNQQ